MNKKINFIEYLINGILIIIVILTMITLILPRMWPVNFYNHCQKDMNILQDCSYFLLKNDMIYILQEKKKNNIEKKDEIEDFYNTFYNKDLEFLDFHKIQEKRNDK